MNEFINKKNAGILIFLVFNLLLNQSLNAQNLHLPPTSNVEDDWIISPVAVAGYTLVGLGASTIIYNAVQKPAYKNSEYIYIAGGVMVTAGILILIFRDKEPKINYWNGLEGRSTHAQPYNFNKYDEYIRLSEEKRLLQPQAYSIRLQQ